VVIFHFSVPISCGFLASEANFITSRRVANNHANLGIQTLTFNQRFNLFVIKNKADLVPEIHEYLGHSSCFSTSEVTLDPATDKPTIAWAINLGNFEPIAK
jgi:hypothetical protein